MDYAIDKFLNGQQDELRDLAAFALYEKGIVDFAKDLDSKGISEPEKKSMMEGLEKGNLSNAQVNMLKNKSEELINRVTEDLMKKRSKQMFWSNVKAGILASLIFSLGSSLFNYYITSEKTINAIRETISGTQKTEEAQPVTETDSSSTSGKSQGPQ